MCETWYRQAKETKRGETPARKSERLIVPLKPANSHEESAEGSGCRTIGPLPGNTSNAQTFGQRVNETAADNQQWFEEPCALVAHARICGSPGGAIPGATRSHYNSLRNCKKITYQFCMFYLFHTKARRHGETVFSVPCAAPCETIIFDRLFFYKH